MYRNQSIAIFVAAIAGIWTLQAGTYFVAQRNPKAGDEGPGSTERPWKTLTKAAAVVMPGDVVMIQDGVYRESVVVKTSGTAEAPIRFETAPGAHVLLSGADQLTGWRKSGETRPIYEVPWPHRFITWSKNMTHPDDDYHRVIGRCEQVAVQSYLLHQVLDLSQLSPGSFFADTVNQKLFVWDIAGRDLNKVLVEASVRPEILRIEGAYVYMRGLAFRWAANAAQHGAVLLLGRHDRLEDCMVESMNASGATFAAEYLMVRHCTLRNNGQLGFGANGAHHLLFTECVVENNNTKGFDRGWEAGGDKLVLCRQAVLERSQFLRNRGSGVWFDIGNENCTVRQCLIADNEDAGIFDEISFGLQAHDNIIVGNGFASTPGGWGAQAGIVLSSSPDCRIERNLLFGNREGFNFREQTRTTPTINDRNERAVWNHDETIFHNIIACNRDAQVWGWFDMKDGRQWPATAGGPRPASSEAAPQSDLAAKYVSTNTQGQPTGLTLEQLRIQFEDNLYYACSGQGWFEWGVTWGRHQSYPTLREFDETLRIDKRGEVLNPQFADPQARDFRLDSHIMSKLKSHYPRGEIPGAVLGTFADKK